MPHSSAIKQEVRPRKFQPCFLEGDKRIYNHGLDKVDLQVTTRMYCSVGHNISHQAGGAAAQIEFKPCFFGGDEGIYN